MRIGKAFKNIREESGIKQREMAARLGMTPTALWKIENGRVYPKKSTIDAFCFATKTPLARLYSISFEAKDFAPAPSVSDVLSALRDNGVFNKEEIDNISARLLSGGE